MWNELKEVIQNKSEKRLPKMKKQKKANLMLEQTMEITRKEREAKPKKDKIQKGKLCRISESCWNR